MSKKFKHTVDIETDLAADDLEQGGALKHPFWTAKIIKTEEIKPPVLPLKVGDRFRRINSPDEIVTVVYKGKTRWSLEWDDGVMHGWTEDQIVRAWERIP